jgi:hypothetical protein
MLIFPNSEMQEGQYGNRINGKEFEIIQLPYIKILKIFLMFCALMAINQ